MSEHNYSRLLIDGGMGMGLASLLNDLNRAHRLLLVYTKEGSPTDEAKKAKPDGASPSVG